MLNYKADVSSVSPSSERNTDEGLTLETVVIQHLLTRLIKPNFY